jgi:signal transduction histidine kinase
MNQRNTAKPFFGILFLLFSNFGLLAQVSNLNSTVIKLTHQTKDSIHIAAHTYLYVDNTMHLSIEEIQTKPFFTLDSFAKDKTCDRTKTAYWLRFEVENTTNDTVLRSFQTGMYDSLSIFMVYNGVAQLPIKLGVRIRKHPQPQKTNYPSNRSVLVAFPPKQKTIIYVQIKSNTVDFPTPILFNSVAEANFFYFDLLQAYTWNACFMGILFFMMCNVLFNYFNSKNQTYLYYFGYIFMQLFFYWRDLEVYNQFASFFPSFLLDYKYRIPISWGWAFFYIFFLGSFFEAKKKMPMLYFWLKISVGILTLVFFIDRVLVSIDYHLAWHGTVVMRTFIRVFGFILLGVLIAKLGENPLVKYILSGTILYTLGSIETGIDTKTSIFWDNTLIWHQLGVLGELICFNLALSAMARLTLEEKEKVLLENQRLALEKEQTQSRIRSQISQDIHDEVGAGLTKISLAAQITARMPEAGENGFRERIENIGKEAQIVGNQLRDIVFATNPDFDQFEDMQAYFRENANDFWANSPINTFFDFPATGHNPIVSPDIKRQLLLIFKEGQNNVAKYANAQNVHLTFKLTAPDAYFMEIKDDGIGFDTAQVNGFSKGLTGMHNRAAAIGAVLQVNSTIGKGTSVQIGGKL